MEISSDVSNWWKIKLSLNQTCNRNSKSILKLKDEMIFEELKMLHNKSIVDPIDQASDNVPLVCQM